MAFFKPSAGIHNDLDSFSKHFGFKANELISEALDLGSRGYREAVERGFDRAMTILSKDLTRILERGGFSNKKGRSFSGAGNLTLEYRQAKRVTSAARPRDRVLASQATEMELMKAKKRLRAEYLEKYGWGARHGSVTGKGVSQSYLDRFTKGYGKNAEKNAQAIERAKRDAKNRLVTRILDLEKHAELEKESLTLAKKEINRAPNNFFKGYRHLIRDQGYTTEKTPSPSNLKGPSLISWLRKLSSRPEQTGRLLRQVLGGLSQHISGNPFKYAYKTKGRNGAPLKSPYFVKEERSGKFSRVKIKDAIMPNVKLKTGYSINANGSITGPDGARLSAVDAAKKGVIGSNVTFSIMSKFYKAVQANRTNAFMRLHREGGGKHAKYGGIFGASGSIQGAKLEAMALDRYNTHGHIDPMTERFFMALDPKDGEVFKAIGIELQKFASSTNTKRGNTLGVSLQVKVKK